MTFDEEFEKWWLTAIVLEEPKDLAKEAWIAGFNYGFKEGRY